MQIIEQDPQRSQRLLIQTQKTVEDLYEKIRANNSNLTYGFDRLKTAKALLPPMMRFVRAQEDLGLHHTSALQAIETALAMTSYGHFCNATRVAFDKDEKVKALIVDVFANNKNKYVLNDENFLKVRNAFFNDMWRAQGEPSDERSSEMDPILGGKFEYRKVYRLMRETFAQHNSFPLFIAVHTFEQILKDAGAFTQVLVDENPDFSVRTSDAISLPESNTGGLGQKVLEAREKTDAPKSITP